MKSGLIFSPLSPFPFLSPSPSPNLRKLSVLRSAVSPNPNSSSNGGSKETNLKIRYGGRWRRQQAKREKKEKEKEKEEGEGKPSKKKWEEMGVTEKALEVYLGEKGILFWLNKLAYASIFLVIGGWILFRFVGPSLGLYQLDSPALSPTSIFKNS